MRYDVAVIGAGIVGLATALRVLEREPGLRVAVVEAERRVGAHQSSHNSGVLHAGVYYPPGSRKAELCRRGKAALERFADEHAVARTTPGKVIVALDETEVPRLAELERRATTNGVPGLRRLDAAELHALEPNVAGVAALHSPTTGSIDFGAVCDAMARALGDAGADLLLGHRVTAIAERPDAVTLTTPRGEVTADRIVACAGLHADRLAHAAGAPTDPRIVPFRGSWLVLRAERSDVVNGHVYPVPDPRFPFLGVHLSPRVDGEVWIGPNAVLASGREAYDGRPDPADLADVARTPGAWRLAARHWRTGAVELWRDRNRAAYLREVRRYVPSIEDGDVRDERPTGIRAQALTPDGDLVDDFAFDTTPRTLHVRNAPSPAATASLAIGEVVADMVLDART